MHVREIDRLLSEDASFLVAAHELKSPLSIIRQLSLTLKSKNVDLSTSQEKKLIQQISLTSERALRLVQDLTKVAKLEDAMFKLEPINAQKICEDTLHELADLYEVNGRNIKVNKKSSSYLAVANYDLLHSVLLNFCDNALYSSNKNSQVEINIQNVKNKVRISVRNYGDNLPNSVWKMVKGKNKLPLSSGDKMQNSGLGIYIAHNFANAMNGEIGVIKHKNGNTFFVDLNRSEQLSLI